MDWKLQIDTMCESRLDEGVQIVKLKLLGSIPQIIIAFLKFSQIVHS